ARQRLAVVPRQPLARLLGDGLVMALELREVVEGIATVELCGVDEGHVHVSYVGTTLTSIEERAVPVLDRHLQRPLADVVVQRGAGHAEEERETVPALEEVVERLTEARVGLDVLVRELCLHRAPELGHERPAQALMREETLLGRQPLLLAGVLDLVDTAHLP